MRDLGTFKQTWLVAKLYPRWAAPTILVLGVLAYFFEGLGIGLFIPLLDSLQNKSQSHSFGHVINGMLAQLSALPVKPRLVSIVALIFACILLKNVVNYINSLAYTFLNTSLLHRLRVTLCDKLMSVNYSYLQQRGSGPLLNSLGAEAWRVGMALSALTAVSVSGCAIFVFSILLLFLSWQMTLIVILSMAVVWLTMRLTTWRINQLSRRAVTANGALTSRIAEVLGGMVVIRAFNQEENELRRFDGASARVRDLYFRMDALGLLAYPLHEVLSAAIMLSIFTAAVLHDQSSLPLLVTFVMVLFRLQPQIRQLSWGWANFVQASGAVLDTVQLLHSVSQQNVLSGRLDFAGMVNGLAFDHVSFRYESGGNPALHDASFEIKTGQTVAIVGGSGAGKSTIVHLIGRLYDPDAGDIRVDGKSLRDLDLATWRKGIGLVSQDVYIFPATIKENIAYGRPDANEAEIIAAARLANAHDFIAEFPHGYDSVAGDRGVRLSGGQRQRIALARAIIRDPPILILDEATNALDSLSERIIQEALYRFAHRRTLIIVAHRLSTIAQADQIIVLDHGRVVEQGDANSLVRAGGLFSQMYSLQQRALAAP